MNYNRDTRKIGFCETVYEATAEQSLEADINLPDYCPEIQRILKCSVIPNISSVQNNSGRITTDAIATVRILYLGENGKTAAYEQNYPLQKFVESGKVTSDCAVDVRIKTDYANCRAVNPRRVDIRAMLTFIFKATDKREETILCSADGAGIQTVTEEINTASLCGLSERAFSLSEVIELGDDKPPISQIINVSACAIASEIKIINNKALIKGNCNVKIYYIGDESASIESMEHSMPISQIIEAEGLKEECKPSLRLNVCSCESIPKADSSGNMRLIDLNVRISAFTAAFEEIPISLICDAYSTEFPSENSQKNIELLTFNDNFDTSFTNKVVLESIGVSVDCVLAVWCSEIKYGFVPKEDKCGVSGTYQANILYRDSENQIGIIQKPVDFEFQVKMATSAERFLCTGSVQIMSCSCAVTGDSRLELKTELCASGMILNLCLKKYIGDIVLSSENKAKSDNCALTIYFCDKNETIWNIARRYNTTVEAIKTENDIDGDIIENKCMLMIPSSK